MSAPKIWKNPNASAPSKTEEAVILLSRPDQLASTNALSWIDRLLLGAPCFTSLANFRLETLRLFAILLRTRGDALALAKEEERLSAVGYDRRQLAEMRTRIADDPSAQEPMHRQGLRTSR